MKDKVIGIASLLLVLVFALVAWSDEPAVPQETRLITVTGDAEVRVVPDQVILTLGVETWDKNLNVAREQNDEIVARVLALASEAGIDPDHVQTDYVSIEPRYRDGYYDERDFIGFFVRKTVVITLRDISKFESLLARTLDAGVNYVQGIEFRTSELRQHRDEARALAVRAAEEKAIAMAQELGQEVGNPYMIREEYSGWWSTYNAWWGARWPGGMAQNVIQEIGGNALAGATSMAPGQIAISARVSVSFELTE